MPFTVFEQAYLLQSLGWAIANSFWQTGVLWLLYQVIVYTDRKLPALVKHHLSVTLLFMAGAWFMVTAVQNYRLLSTAANTSEILVIGRLSLQLQPLQNAFPFLSLIYLLLLSLQGIRFFGRFRAARLLQTTGLSKAPIDIRLFVKNTAIHLGIKKKISVWMSVHVEVPSVTGFLRPVILLPAAMINHLSLRQTEAILLHELAHIRRNDYLVNCMQAVVELVLFFNPFAVLLGKIAKRERENCCDDWVMNFKYDQREYARALLALEEQRHSQQFGLALAATNGKRNLLLRIKRLFNTEPETQFRYFQKFKLTGLCIVLLAVMMLIVPGITERQAAVAATAEPAIKEAQEAGFTTVPTPQKDLKNTFKNEVALSTPAKPAKKATGKKSRNRLPAPSVEYVNAYINEELLKPAVPVETVITPVIEKEVQKQLKYFVKVEEQRSGKKQTNTYYLELNNQNGTPTVKPLILLNRGKAEVNKIAPQILKNTLDTLPVLNSRKRVTS